MAEFKSILCVIICVLLGACTSNKKNDSSWSEESEKPYENRWIVKSLRNFTHKEDVQLTPGSEVCYHFEYDIELPVKDFPEYVIETMRQNILSLAFQREVRKVDWNTFVTDNVEKLVRKWRSVWMEEAMEYGESPMMEENDIIRGRMLDPYCGIVSYVCDSYGPGFNTYKRSVNMDLKTGRIVEESNLFRSGYEPILRELLIEYLPENIYMDSEDLRTFQPSRDFYLTRTGITYIYPQGEIGCMADGVIEITIPWNAFSLLRVK
jgi:hypothetical protein